MINLKLTCHLRYIFCVYLFLASIPLTHVQARPKTNSTVTQKKQKKRKKHHYIAYACMTAVLCIISFLYLRGNQNSSEITNPVEEQPDTTSAQANTNATATTSLPSQDDHIEKKYKGVLTDEFINYLEKSNEWQNIEAILKEVGIQSVSPQSEKVIDNSVKKIQEESDLHALIDRLNPNLSRLPNFTDAIQPASRAPDIQRKYKLSKYLISQIREELLKRSPALDLSSGVKPIQNIIKDFEEIRNQSVPEVCKTIKKLIRDGLGLSRKKEKNKEREKKFNHRSLIKKWTDLAILRTIFKTNKITRKLYKKVNEQKELSMFYKKKTYWFLDKKGEKRRSDFMEKVKNELFAQPIFPAVNELVNKRSIANKIDVSKIDINGLQKKINAVADLDLFKEYILKLAEVCFEIAFQEDPELKIAIPENIQGKNWSQLKLDHPDHSGNYLEAYLSEETENVNYCLFPAIIRADTNHLISGLHICFHNTLPSFTIDDIGLNGLHGKW